MEEKKIIYKSIDEQLAEEEAKERASASSKKTVNIDEKSTGKAIARTVAGPKKGKKKLRMKKSVRRTVGSLLLATSLVVAAIPVGGVNAVTDTLNDDGSYKEANYISSTEIALPSVTQILTDKNVNDEDFTYQGHVVPTGVTAGTDGRYGFPLELIDDPESGQKKPKSIDINGHKYYYVDTNVYLASGAIDPLYLLDNTNSKIKNCLNPKDFVDNKLSLDSYYGWNDVPSSLEPETIFVEDGTSYKWIVSKESASYGVRYRAQKYRWQENTTPDTTMSVPLLTDEEENSDAEKDEKEGSTPNPTPTTNPTQELEPDSTPTPTPDPSETPENPAGPSESEKEDETVEEEKIDADIAGSILQSMTGIIRVAVVDDPDDGVWVKDGDEIVLCRENATYNELCDNSFSSIPQSIRTVNIPDYSNLKNIGKEAFKGTAITSINLVGNQLASIGVSCFAGCTGLSSVSLGEAIQEIGDGAFAEDAIGEIHLPHAADVGCAAFYGNSITNVDVSQCQGIEVGDYAFAVNKNLSIVDLDYSSQDKPTISNLGSIGGLFAGCSALSAVALPTEFEGTLQSGIFQNCTGLSVMIIRNAKSDFNGGEFDRTKVNVYGPDPENMDPESTKGAVGTVNSYNTCLGWNKATAGNPGYSYDYRYNGCSMPIAFKASNQMPDYTVMHKYCNNYIEDGVGKIYPKTVIQIDGSEFISGKHERNGGPNPYTLVIDGGVGVYPNQYNVSGINSTVFENDSYLDGVRIGDKYENNYCLSYLGEGAFRNCPNLKNIFINVNGTTISSECFANNGAVESIEFGNAGSNASIIGEKAFYNCGASSYELPVAFINDDLRKGSEGDYAVIGSIGKDAFSHSGRTGSIIFKGPMDRSYYPYNYAIGNSEAGIEPAKVGSGNYFIKYKSGNPKNLECMYKLNWDSYPTGVYLLSYPNMTSNLGSDSEYPGKTISPRELEKIKAGYPSTTYMSNTTDIENSCITYTKEITIPDGIDYIDIAESMILDVICEETDASFYDLHPMYKSGSKEYTVYKDANGLYSGKCSYSSVDPLIPAYKQFRYVKDLQKVIFNGPQTFPDKMFEGCTDLEQVDFNKDVISLGNLPFYLPDTEGDNVEGHIKRSPSVIRIVNFNSENTDYTDNTYYKGSESGLNQMIKSESVNKSGNKEIALEQIFPLRGVSQTYNPYYNEGDQIITSAELSDIDIIKEYAARDCDSLIEIQLKDATKRMIIKEGAFYDCDDLTKVYFPDEITEVNKNAFGHISNKTLNIYVPSIATTFQDDAFDPTNGSDTNPGVYIWGPDDARVIDKFTDYANRYSNVHFDVDTAQIKPLVKFIINNSEVYKEQIDYRTNVVTIVRDKVDPKWNPDGKYVWKGTDQKTGETGILKDQLLEHDTNFYAEEIKTYTVSFRYKDGTEITKTTVTEGKKIPDDILASAEFMAKKIEPVDGKYFSGWDKPTGNAVIEDMIITAQYNKNGEKYTVSVYLNSITPDNRIWYKEFPYKNSYYFTKALRDDLVNNTLTKTKIIDGETMTYNGTKNDSIPLEDEEITESLEIIAIYTVGSSTSTPSSSSSSSKSTTSKSTTSKSSSSHTSSSSSSKSSSSSSSSAYPVFVNSQEAGAAPGAVGGIGSTVYLGDGSGSGGSGGSGSGNKGSGNTTVVSTTGGISDPSKISATVNGSSDNYVIKITQTQEADEMGLAALHSAYGEDISPIRYLPFDISLYDSTGTNKISPVPDGMSVSLTMPIPDDLAIYGGNAKIASTAGGQLDKLQPRFTVINGVPCMTFTCTHLSPYMIYVDTANLTEAGIADATPKTADGIHPKWFLCFGLAAIAIVLFLKKDPEEYIKKAAA